MTALPDPDPEGLSPQARSLLDAAREGLSPDAAAVRRVYARIHVATAGAAAGTAIGVKLGLAALIVAAVAAGAIVFTRSPRRSPPATTAPAIELASQPHRPQQAVAHEAPSPASDEDLIVIEPVVAPVRHTARGSAAPRPALPPSTPPPPSTPSMQSGPPAASVAAASPAAPGPGIALGREVALIDLARAALHRGDPDAALRVVREYAAEAADRGQLAQDAAAIEVEALCKLGDPAARGRRTAFEARFPGSAQRARLEAICR
jgi:hypothetical protein